MSTSASSNGTALNGEPRCPNCGQPAESGFHAAWNLDDCPYWVFGRWVMGDDLTYEERLHIDRQGMTPRSAARRKDLSWPFAYNTPIGELRLKHERGNRPLSLDEAGALSEDECPGILDAIAEWQELRARATSA